MLGTHQKHDLPHIVWQDPSGSILIHVRLTVVEEIGNLVNGAARENGERGVEVGGILLGRIGQPGEPVVIEAVEPIVCEHRRGASFTLSGKDKKLLASRLHRKPWRRKGLQAVGYYRSHTRPGMYVDAEDFAVIRSYFPQPQQVTLLVKPWAEHGNIAAFFFWEEGDMRRQSPYSQFPFDAAALMQADSAQAQNGCEVVAPYQPEPPPGRPPRSYPWQVHPARWAGGAAAVAALSIGILAVASWYPGTPRASTAGLRLTVARAQDGFKLTWNRASDVIARASGGVLTISEQGTERQVRLTREELMHGSVAYQPAGKDVSFRLDLTPEGGTVASAAAQTAVPPEDAAAAPPETPKPAVSRPRPKPAPTRTFDAGKVLAARAEPVTGSADRLVIEPPPPIGPASARDSAAELSSALKPTTRPAPVLYAKIDMEPVKAGRVRRVFGRVFGVPERQFEAAKPLRQVAPALPPYLRGQDLPPVEVKVHIDKDGRLERTELLSKDAPSELTERAIDALERWTFAPARVKDEAVDSELILRFDFQP